MNLNVVSYIAYLMISIGMTVWVAHTLSRNGLVFLIDVFNGEERLAGSVNHLLVVGFYLINLGYITLALKLRYLVTSTSTAMEAVSTKVGWALVVLGGMHFFNLYVFSRLRRYARLQRTPPPVEPDTRINVPAGA